MAVPSLHNSTASVRYAELSTAESVEIAQLAISLMARAQPGQKGDTLVLAAALAEELPLGVRTALRLLRQSPDGMCALVFRGLDCLTEARTTPMIPNSVERELHLPSAATLLFASALGQPVSFAAEKEGALVHNVVPVRGHEQIQSNAGSHSELRLHVENAFHPLRPAFIVLSCVRSDPTDQAALRVAPVAAAVQRLSSPDWDVLSSPRFVTSAPPSFGSGVPIVHPALSGDPAAPMAQLDFSATVGVDAEAQAALASFEKLVEGAALNLKVEVGNLAIVDNRVALHGRTAYKPLYNGEDRWLHRVYVEMDSRASRSARGGTGYVIQ